MVPAFLFPDSIACEDGHGAETSLGDSRGRSLLLTLGITRIVEQESLDVSIWGSADGHAWQLLASFPRKFYCGIYSLMLDLSRRCEITLGKAMPSIARSAALLRSARAGAGRTRPPDEAQISPPDSTAAWRSSSSRLVLVRSPACQSTMMIAAETADVRPIFPQKPLQLLRIQAIRDLAEVHDADRARGRKAAFTEDLNAPVRI